MKFTLKSTVILFSIITNLFFSSSSFAQKILQDTVNGEKVFVYPYKSEINFHSAYFKGMKSIGNGQTSMKGWFIAMNGGVFDRAMYKEYKSIMKNQDFRDAYKEERYLRSAKLKKAIRKNPYPLIEKKYTLGNDIVPSLDKIPDGRYVQYFDTFALILPNGKTKMVGNQVSGIFTLKNNILEGEAIWFNVKGDTLKKGMFLHGLKEGEWLLESRRTEYSLSRSSVKQYIQLGYPEMDTTKEYVHYKNGLMHGPYRNFQNSAYPILEGQHAENEEVGEWVEREIQYTGFGYKRKRSRNNSTITFRYTPVKTETIVHKPIIRYKLYQDYDYDEFDFESKYEPVINFSKLYSIAYPKEDNELELEEESVTSYEGAEEEYMEGEEGDYYEEDYGYGNNYVRQKYDYKSGKYITYPELIDSLGITFNFSGVYEKFYPNGQKMMRYEFKNGELAKEDTIYWDNGKPYDVINFNIDSNQFVQTIYDYSGARYKEIVYDSIGEFVRLNYEPESVKYITIDGLVAEDRINGGKYFFYDKLDTLGKELKDSLVIFRSWFRQDTSLLYNRSYIPSDRRLEFTLYSTMGNPVMESGLNFSEDFESWTGWRNYHANDLRLGTISSASFSDFYPRDSFPQNHVNSYDELFQTTEDYTLYRNEMAYSGEVDLRFSENKFGTNVSDKRIKMSFTSSGRKSYKIYKDIQRYRRTGKARNAELLSIIDASESDEEFSNGIYANLFSGVYDFISYPYNEYDDYGRRNRRNTYPSAKNVTGYFVGGKPNGIWKVIDQNGKLMSEIPYQNGNVNGTVRNYSYAYPAEEDLYMEYEIGDTLPSKKKYYLQSTTEYKNGIRNGKSVAYNWLGEVVSEDSYLDGYLNGRAFERNKLAHTELNYENGSLDGYVRTHLTLPAKDSILLFDLNFQNGNLQGESKSYHINGKVAKRGFFLNGDPIDDYEAFDTLGFKYHYVKFQYSYPVEEKIWEENELSVRYKFDWKDSIQFTPDDITSTQSLDEILYSLGIGTEYLDRPYYGRPSLIEKRGINYHMTKYYPNDTVARDGELSKGKKVGNWKFYSYEGEKLYEVNYFDTILVVNDSVQFKSKGILTDYNAAGQKLSESHIIEKFEKYDCSHTDHYEIRQLMTIWQASDTLNRMNGYVKNYYDNGVLQNEGNLKDGLPTGVWKFYDPYGKLNQVGEYTLGKRNGRWLGGDLSKTKYLGDICLNPNMPDLENEIRYREKLLDIVITNYRMGKALNKEFYDVNMNNYDSEEDTEGEIEEVESPIEEEIEEH